MQQVDVNDNDALRLTKFVLPTFQSSVVGCPILTYTLVDATSGITMIDPLTIVPSNKLLHQVYYFKVLITAKGGASFTTLELTLDVGCTPTLILTESASFV